MLALKNRRFEALDELTETLTLPWIIGIPIAVFIFPKCRSPLSRYSKQKTPRWVGVRNRIAVRH